MIMIIKLAALPRSRYLFETLPRTLSLNFSFFRHTTGEQFA
jgi:hypothetical protein